MSHTLRETRAPSLSITCTRTRTHTHTHTLFHFSRLPFLRKNSSRAKTIDQLQRVISLASSCPSPPRLFSAFGKNADCCLISDHLEMTETSKLVCRSATAAISHDESHFLIKRPFDVIFLNMGIPVTNPSHRHLPYSVQPNDPCHPSLPTDCLPCNGCGLGCKSLFLTSPPDLENALVTVLLVYASHSSADYI